VSNRHKTRRARASVDQYLTSSMRFYESRSNGARWYQLLFDAVGSAFDRLKIKKNKKNPRLSIAMLYPTINVYVNEPKTIVPRTVWKINSNGSRDVFCYTTIILLFSNLCSKRNRVMLYNTIVYRTWTEKFGFYLNVVTDPARMLINPVSILKYIVVNRYIYISEFITESRTFDCVLFLFLLVCSLLFIILNRWKNI